MHCIALHFRVNIHNALVKSCQYFHFSFWMFISYSVIFFHCCFFFPGFIDIFILTIFFSLLSLLVNLRHHCWIKLYICLKKNRKSLKYIFLWTVMYFHTLLLYPSIQLNEWTHSFIHQPTIHQFLFYIHHLLHLFLFLLVLKERKKEKKKHTCIIGLHWFTAVICGLYNYTRISDLIWAQTNVLWSSISLHAHTHTCTHTHTHTHTRLCFGLF